MCKYSVEKIENDKSITLKVNDGNTWIQIQPVGKVLDITSNNTETEE